VCVCVCVCVCACVRACVCVCVCVRRLYLVVGFLAHATFIAFYISVLRISNIEELAANSWILFLSAAVLGVADACWNTFPPLMMSVFFSDNAGTLHPHPALLRVQHTARSTHILQQTQSLHLATSSSGRA